jgi:hypothetical protein
MLLIGCDIYFFLLDAEEDAAPMKQKQLISDVKLNSVEHNVEQIGMCAS